MAQENLFMLKKLITQESSYKADKFEQHFKESRRYKNNICHYPSINFNKSRSSTTPIVQSYDFNVKNYKIFNTEGTLPKLKNGKNRTNFTALQTKYAITNRELDPHYFKEAVRTKTNIFNKTKNEKNKKEINSVTEKEDEDSSSNQKSDEDEESEDKNSGSGSKSGSENEDDKESGSGSGSGSGSSSGSGSGSGSGGSKNN